MEYAGKSRYAPSLFIEPPVGVSLGLGSSQNGGNVLPIETLYEKSPEDSLELTGQMGNVMKESSHIAYSYAKHFLDQVQPGKNMLKQVI